MLSLEFVRENPDIVKKAARDKQLDPVVVDELLALDEQRRTLLVKVETCRHQVNQNVATIKAELKKQAGSPPATLVKKGKTLKQELKTLETQLNEVEEAFVRQQYYLPNVPAADVPVGKDESGNQVVRQVGKLPKFPFTPRPHQELMLSLDLLDIKRAVNIGGFRTYMLKNQAVLLEQALLNYAIALLVAQGFSPMSAPSLVKEEMMWGTGYFPWGQTDHYYTQDQQILAGTAEVALTAYHAGEIIAAKDLPIKMVGISPCFRREVGTHGKDTQGIIRVHQFNKIEQVIYTAADEKETRYWHEKMLGYSEALLQSLSIPYQVLLMCTGDMGAGQRKKYDLESWFPAQNRYRETHSASYFNDFQARRLKMRYRTKEGKLAYVYTLNNTMMASPRLLACLLENHQREDGSVSIPEALWPYLPFKEIRAH